ncbi:hypothetical protein, partial [Chitinimonas sp. JJ19]|uniref:hypothetical protein n=1 Tax=Chitinimonas sp. JJ19 TaxID=3109352 RepID=UPI0030017E7D
FGDALGNSIAANMQSGPTDAQQYALANGGGPLNAAAAAKFMENHQAQANQAGMGFYASYLAGREAQWNAMFAESLPREGALNDAELAQYRASKARHDGMLSGERTAIQKYNQRAAAVASKKASAKFALGMPSDNPWENLSNLGGATLGLLKSGGLTLAGKVSNVVGGMFNELQASQQRMENISYRGLNAVASAYEKHPHLFRGANGERFGWDELVDVYTNFDQKSLLSGPTSVVYDMQRVLQNGSDKEMSAHFFQKTYKWATTEYGIDDNHGGATGLHRDAIEQVASKLITSGPSVVDKLWSTSSVAAAEWRSLPGGVRIKNIGSYWIKEVDPKAGAIAQWWGRGSLDAQAEGLGKLGELGVSHLYKNGKLITRDAGTYTPGNFWSAWMEGSYRLGTPFNDIRPRNIGANGVIFDPAKHPVQRNLEVFTAAAVFGTGGYLGFDYYWDK